MHGNSSSCQLNTALLSVESKHVFTSGLLYYILLIGAKNLRHVLNQTEAKLKPIVNCDILPHLAPVFVTFICF